MDDHEDEINILIGALNKLKKGELGTPLNYNDPESNTRTAVGLALASLRKEREDHMQRPGLKLNWEVPIVPLLTLVLSLGAGIWWASEKTARLETGLAEVKRQADASTARGLVYAPKNEAMESNNRIQDERISRLAESIVEIRKGNAEQASILWTIRNDLTTVMAQTFNKRAQ